MGTYIHLADLCPGEGGTVEGISAVGEDGARLCRRLYDLGFVENTAVTCLCVSPCGDPKAYRVRGAVIAIRAEDAHRVLLRRG